MIEILPEDFTEVWRQLDAALAFCAPIAASDNKPPRQETASPAQQKKLAALLTDIWNVCKKWKLNRSLFIVNEAREWLVDPARYAVWDSARPGAYKFPKEIPATELNSIYKQLVSIRKIIHEELYSIRFALIPPETVQYFQNPALFGERVAQVFADAYADIMDAGNCLALSLNTSAVFHLMRVSEFGLRFLAKRLKVKLKYPLEFADWAKVIGECDNNIKNLNSKTRGRKKSEQLEFYANAISDCRAFKETWRDCVMHARRTSFQHDEAKYVFDRVSQFMQRLALDMPHK